MTILQPIKRILQINSINMMSIGQIIAQGIQYTDNKDYNYYLKKQKLTLFSDLRKNLNVSIR